MIDIYKDDRTKARDYCNKNNIKIEAIDFDILELEHFHKSAAVELLTNREYLMKGVDKKLKDLVKAGLLVNLPDSTLYYKITDVVYHWLTYSD